MDLLFINFLKFYSTALLCFSIAFLCLGVLIINFSIIISFILFGVSSSLLIQGLIFKLCLLSSGGYRNDRLSKTEKNI